MNLPRGPDTLCFDKDEFMKVRAELTPSWALGAGPAPPRASPRLLLPRLGRPFPRRSLCDRPRPALRGLLASGLAGAPGENTSVKSCMLSEMA